MRYLFDEETETEVETRRGGMGRASKDASADTEITLGMRSILGIFFGLILICGIFFGLGYSVGRGSSAHASAISASEPGDATPAADSHLPKPSATGQSLTPAATPDASPAAADAATDTAAVPESASPAAPERVSEPSESRPLPAAAPETLPTAKPGAMTRPEAARAIPATQTASSAAAVVPVSDAAPGGKNYMVQIAAVRLQEDADVLVSALKKHGYSAVIRHEAQDQWLHVQVGPFGTRAEANTMRSRLLADGYNAVVK